MQIEKKEYWFISGQNGATILLTKGRMISFRLNDGSEITAKVSNISVGAITLSIGSDLVIINLCDIVEASSENGYICEEEINN